MRAKSSDGGTCGDLAREFPTSSEKRERLERGYGDDFQPYQTKSEYTKHVFQSVYKINPFKRI